MAKQNYRKLINLAIDGITSLTTAPLHISTYVGAFTSFVAFVYIVYLLVRPLFGVPTVPGYASTLAVILFLGGIQLLSLGIIGEYVGRIFNETKRRPLYFVETYHEGAHHTKNKRQVGRFGLVGIINTALDIGILFVLKSLGVPVSYANVVSTSVAFCFSFLQTNSIRLTVARAMLYAR